MANTRGPARIGAAQALPPIPPASVPLGEVDAQGNLVINQNWYLFLYNIQRNVLTTGGQPPLITETIIQSFPTVGALVIPMDDSYTEESTVVPGPQGIQGAQGIQGDPAPAWWLPPENEVDVLTEAISLRI